MPYVERTDAEIIAMLDRWVENHKRPDKPFMTGGGKSYSPRAYVEEIKRRTEFGRSILKSFRDLAKRHNADPLEPLQRMIRARGKKKRQ